MIRSLIPLVAILFSGLASAESCRPDFMANIQAEPYQYVLDNSEIVFIGKPYALESRLYSDEQQEPMVVGKTIFFEVLKILKGSYESEKLKLSTKDGCYCAFDFEFGKLYLIPAQYSSDKGELELLFCRSIKTGEEISATVERITE